MRFMVRPRDGVIWRDRRCQTLVTPSDSTRVAIPGAVRMMAPGLERHCGAERGNEAADTRVGRPEPVSVDEILSDRIVLRPGRTASMIRVAAFHLSIDGQLGVSTEART